MPRRHFLLFVVLAAIFQSISPLFAQEIKKPPNVLFISIDDLRPELGCYGQEQILSPNIDNLAEEGVLFSRAYCQAPVCGASRASLLTGLRPTSTRFITFNTYAQKDAPDAISLPQVFKQNGYYTISNGKVFHKQDDMDKQSWSEPAWRPEILGRKSLDPQSKKFIKKLTGNRKRGPFYESADVPDNAYYDGKVAEKTVADLRRLKKMDQPFFLAAGFVRPHLPLYAPKKYWDLYDHDDIQLAENRYAPKDAPISLSGSGEIHDFHHRALNLNGAEFHRSARHAYYACVSYVDAQVGRILNCLEELGLKENTIVVLWGDHGWHLGEHNFWAKNNLLHNATRAPLIFRLPASAQSESEGGDNEDLSRGESCNRLVELVDIYPTLCELAGIPSAPQIEGTSFVPLLHDPNLPWKEAAFCRFKMGSTIITEQYSYTEYLRGRHGEKMLFDLKNDPAENQNIAGLKSNHDLVKKLSRLLSGGWGNVIPVRGK